MGPRDLPADRVEPVVSVIIPCHNSAATIGMQLESLARQHEFPPFEVIVVDNRSSDDLRAAIEPWRNRLDVHVVTAPAHANPGYARNVGAAQARSPKLAFCDSDDYLANTWVRSADQALSHHTIVNGDSVPTDHQAFARGADHVTELTGYPASLDVEVPGAPLAYPILLGNTCAFQRETFMALGGFDTSVPYGVEDNDLALRVQAAGEVIGRAPGMRLAYRMRSESDETLGRAFRGGYRHMLLAHRHQLFGRSPSLQRGWYFGLVRCAGAGLRMIVRPATRDWRNLGRRTALQVGLLAGHLRYGLLGRPPKPMLGVGLEK